MSENPNSSRSSTPPKTPAWVKVFFIVVVLLIVLVVAVHLMGIRFDHGGASGLFATLASSTSL